MLFLVALWLYAGAVAAGDQAVTGNSGDPASGSAGSEGSVPGSFVPGSIVPGPANSRWIPEFTNLVSFGDSYTDEGRLDYFQINHTAPPVGWFPAVTTSTPGGGYSWARQVSQQTGVTLFNYAVKGAVCDNSMISRIAGFGWNAAFPDVRYEVAAFTADVRSHSVYRDRIDRNTVCSMWIGTNDLGAGGFMTDSSLGGQGVPEYVDCVFERFDGIYAAGVRFFVLMNNAPLQLSPLYGMPPTGLVTSPQYWGNKDFQPANTSEASGKMKEYSKMANALFDYRTPFELKVKNRYPGARIAVFDVNRLMEDMYGDPKRYFGDGANVTGQFAVGAKRNGELENFMWYDELHPSAQTDKWIAEEFVRVAEGGSKYATYWDGGGLEAWG